MIEDIVRLMILTQTLQMICIRWSDGSSSDPSNSIQTDYFHPDCELSGANRWVLECIYPCKSCFWHCRLLLLIRSDWGNGVYNCIQLSADWRIVWFWEPSWPIWEIERLLIPAQEVPKTFASWYAENIDVQRNARHFARSWLVEILPRGLLIPSCYFATVHFILSKILSDIQSAFKVGLVATGFIHGTSSFCPTIDARKRRISAGLASLDGRREARLRRDGDGVVWVSFGKVSDRVLANGYVPSNRYRISDLLVPPSRPFGA